MATKSRARKALEAALDAAVTPQEKSDVANRLSKLIEREGRDLARRRRAKAAKPKPEPAPVFDGNEPFELETFVAPLTAAGAVRVPGTVNESGVFVPDGLTKPAAVPPTIAPEAPDPRTQNGYSTTRVIAALNSPNALYWDSIDRVYREDYDPRSSVGPDGGSNDWMFAPTPVVQTDTYSGGKFQSEREAEESEAERPLTWDEQCQRASQRRWR
jgi:hypothetical protein